ncbi:unnamed protein product [Sphenostylis stenocarpa]|uniref:Uncharacterized protein n=1 Tax=Sphenostylis stenocarpa TaxID=92480 RepID=A0AA86TRS2_9FABA|nr:unnamed protein product [Sphenostylis stenocarpa]
MPTPNTLEKIELAGYGERGVLKMTQNEPMLHRSHVYKKELSKCRDETLWGFRKQELVMGVHESSRLARAKLVTSILIKKDPEDWWENQRDRMRKERNFMQREFVLAMFVGSGVKWKLQKQIAVVQTEVVGFKQHALDISESLCMHGWRGQHSSISIYNMPLPPWWASPFVRNKHSSRYARLSIRSASAATNILSHVLPRLTHVMTNSGLPPTLLKNPILESTLEVEAKNWPAIGFHFTIGKQSRVSTVFSARGRQSNNK